MSVPVLKDPESEHAVRSAWRHALKGVVKSIQDKSFDFQNVEIKTSPLSPNEVTRIVANIEDYGCHLRELPDESWNTSVCSWQIDYWELLIDLFTEEEGLIDLALTLRVYEDSGYRFEVMSIHVP